MELNHHIMQNKNLIRFVHSLVLLPFLTTGLNVNTKTLDTSFNENAPKTLFIEKLNTSPLDFLSLNQDEDSEENKKEQLITKKAEAIDNYFKERDMPLAGYGRKMVIEAEKNNLDWRLLPAIAVRESTGGKFACKRVKFSAFGWGSCKINFDSYDESIEVIALNLGGNNPRTSRHYANKTTYGILQAYNPPSIVAKYAEQVIKIMDSIGDKDLSLEANS